MRVPTELLEDRRPPYSKVSHIMNMIKLLIAEFFFFFFYCQADSQWFNTEATILRVEYSYNGIITVTEFIIAHHSNVLQQLLRCFENFLQMRGV